MYLATEPLLNITITGIILRLLTQVLKYLFLTLAQLVGKIFMVITTETDRLKLQAYLVHRQEIAQGLSNKTILVGSYSFLVWFYEQISRVYSLAQIDKQLKPVALEIAQTTHLTQEIFDAIVLTGKTTSIEALLLIQEVFKKVCSFIGQKRLSQTRQQLPQN